MHRNFHRDIDSLLRKMSLREKIGQLNQPETPTAATVQSFRDAVRKGEVGSILMSVGATAGNDAQGSIDVDFYNELQRIAVEESPNGIPLLLGRDVIHGHRTVYPVPLAMAASFNPALIQTAYSDIAVEASNESVHWTFTPMVDMCRDPRWGRIIEGTGEDPYLGSRVAEAVVKGLQGDLKKGTLLACAKHFIGYGASEGGRDYHRTEITDYSLYNYYLPAFKAAIDAGAVTVMSSFNDISGQPLTSSRYYLTEILRNKLGFEGFVVSDYDAIIQLMPQGVAEDGAQAAQMAITAGLDMDMHDGCYVNHLEALVESGQLPEAVIDNAVRNVLAVKYLKGLFDDSYCHPKVYDRQSHLANACELAAESMVLLKNNDNLLPLDRSQNVILAGPFANERRSLLGSWTIDGKAEETETLADALSRNSQGIVFRADGRGLLFAQDRADILILALGEDWKCTGEARAVSNISLSADQLQMIREAKASGKKVIGILFCGRPIAMQGIADDLDAVIYAWHGGSMCAQAVCQILYGDTVPSGRLPSTLPRLATHIPLYYNVTSSGREVNCYYGENPQMCYVDSLPTPYYPFGYGLSYTTFTYGDIQCARPSIASEDLKNGKTLSLSVKIQNTGNWDGKETVQLYIHDKVASMMRPLKELKAFEKVMICKGAEKEVTFQLGYHDLGFFLPNGDYVVEKGEIDIYIGESCLTNRKITVKII